MSVYNSALSLAPRPAAVSVTTVSAVYDRRGLGSARPRDVTPIYSGRSSGVRPSLMGDIAAPGRINSARRAGERRPDRARGADTASRLRSGRAGDGDTLP